MATPDVPGARGTIGADSGRLTPAQFAEGFLGQIEPVLPGLTAKWNGRVLLYFWKTYPWTLGSYTYWKVGQYTGFSGAVETGYRQLPRSWRH